MSKGYIIKDTVRAPKLRDVTKRNIQLAQTKIIFGEAATPEEAAAARKKLEEGQIAPSQQVGQTIGETAQEIRYRRIQAEKAAAERERLRRRGDSNKSITE
jgi:hypothetical protein